MGEQLWTLMTLWVLTVGESSQKPDHHCKPHKNQTTTVSNLQKEHC